jgi:hypothetical protein
VGAFTGRDPEIFDGAGFYQLVPLVKNCRFRIGLEDIPPKTLRDPDI